MLLVILTSLVPLEASSPEQAAVPRRSPTDYAQWNLPPEFVHNLENHAVLDLYSGRFHAVENEREAAIAAPPPPVASRSGSIRVVRPSVPEPILRYRLSLHELFPPVRNYRAPILNDKDDLRPATFPAQFQTEQQRRASEIIRTRLAYDGLLGTAAQAIEVLGPAHFLTNAASGLEELRKVAVPDDLLAFYRVESSKPVSATNTLCWIARRLADGESAKALQAELQSASFDFHVSSPGFELVEETGLADLKLIRLQIGGGYDNGIIRGGIIDVSGQLIEALPRASFLVSVQNDLFDNIVAMAADRWRLRRPNQLVLVRQEGPVQPWAQDNGKAGTLRSPDGSRTLATVVPRYASQEEVNARLVAGDSFLMDGLEAAGYRIFQSPLLFQGGNLLAVQGASASQSRLLISETELYRNRALGLSYAQALDALRQEFGVRDCAVIPSVSYHLDFDVTLRAYNGQLLAFVNDMESAARLIVRRGVDALEQGSVLTKAMAQQARVYLADDDIPKLVAVATEAFRPFRNEKLQYRSTLANLFASGPADTAAFNLQCFLGALDILESQRSPRSSAKDLRSDYLSALRDVDSALGMQAERLKEIGCKVVKVPSLPDLHHSINYLNGLHDPGHFYMPAMGGFYGSLDDAAAEAFQRVMPTIKVVRIYDSDAQKNHGGLHCVAATYPRLDGE